MRQALDESRRSGVLVVGLLFGASGRSLAARRPRRRLRRAGTVNVEADPIRCWWRTSASAVRVGEPFSLVLTCAIVENETTTVVPDQSRLDPAAMQLPPFEVIGGQREPDLRSDSRRFFQYRYSLRLINEEMFGKDAHIPSVQINYNLESRRSGAARRFAAAIATTSCRRNRSGCCRSCRRTRPTSATRRPGPSATSKRSVSARACLLMVAGVLFAAAALVIVMALLRLMRAYRQRRRRSAGGCMSDGAVLGGVGRELSAVRRASEGSGWTRELAGRALAALRIAGSVALGRAGRPDGRRAARRQRLRRAVGRCAADSCRGKKVPGLGVGDGRSDRRSARDRGGLAAATARRSKQLQTALARFTTALFGRERQARRHGARANRWATAPASCGVEARKPLAREEDQGAHDDSRRRAGTTRAWSR